MRTDGYDSIEQDGIRAADPGRLNRNLIPLVVQLARNALEGVRVIPAPGVAVISSLDPDVPC